MTALMLSFLVMASTARAQFLQQGPKLVGVATAALSADGNTVVGGRMYTRSGGVWSQQGTGFGGAGVEAASVAVSGDANTAIVGSPHEDNGAGAARVYTRSGGVWSQQGAKLVGTGAVGHASQGYSVAVSADGNTAVVGGYNDDSYLGAAWVYTRSGGVWSQQAKLVGTDAVRQRDGRVYQGLSVAVSGDGNTIVVGGPLDRRPGGGAAWVFTRSGDVWSQQGAKLTGAVGGTLYGWSIAVSADGNTAFVGGLDVAGGLGAPTFGVAAALAFTRSGDVWSQQGAKLVGTGAVGPGDTGSPVISLALSGDGNTAVVGWADDNNYAGAAWVYTRSGNVWSQQGAKLVGTGAVGDANQGSSVAVSADGNTALVAGPGDNNYAAAAWVFVNSNRPPDCGHAVASPASIWPLSHRLMPIAITGITDSDGDPVTVTVTSVTQDEPLGARDADDADHEDAAMVAGHGPSADEVQGAGDDRDGNGHHGIGDREDGNQNCADAVIDPKGGVAVRAERAGKGNGRVYAIWFTASDGRGGTCDGSVQVCVPHDRHHLACVDDGEDFNSLGPCPGHDRRHGHDRDALAAVTLTEEGQSGSTATLRYSLPEASDVRISLYDIAGRRVMTFEGAGQSAGSHAVPWNTSGLAHGMYFCRLEAGRTIVTKSVLMRK